MLNFDGACYRIASAPTSPLQGTQQTIPRIIAQTGWSWETALAHNEQYMRTWWQYNPEFEYRFYNDSQERTAIPAPEPLRAKTAHSQFVMDHPRICRQSVLRAHNHRRTTCIRTG